MHFHYTIAPSIIDSILKAIKSEIGFKGLRCAYLRDGAAYVRTLACCVRRTIDTSSRINVKLGGVNALPRSHALKKLVSAPFIIMGMCHLRLSESRLIYGCFLLTVRC
jgi:hypothetical protein